MCRQAAAGAIGSGWRSRPRPACRRRQPLSPECLLLRQRRGAHALAIPSAKSVNRPVGSSRHLAATFSPRLLIGLKG